MSSNIIEKFNASNRAYVESLQAVASTTRVSLERMTVLNLQTTRDVLKDTVAGAKHLIAIRSAHQLLEAQKTLARYSLEKLIRYTRDAYEINCDTQQKLNEIYAAQYSEMNKNMLGMLEKTGKFMPGNAEAAVSAVKSMIIANESIYADINKVTRQFAEITDANVTNAAKAAFKITANAAAKSSKATTKKAAENVVTLPAKTTKQLA